MHFANCVALAAVLFAIL